MAETRVQVFRDCRDFEEVEKRIAYLINKNKFYDYHLKMINKNNEYRLIIYRDIPYFRFPGCSDNENSFRFCGLRGGIEKEGDNFFYRYEFILFPKGFVITFIAIFISGILMLFTEIFIVYAIMFLFFAISMLFNMYFLIKCDKEMIDKILKELN